MSQTLHDKIEAYLADTMPAEERQSFEQTIVADPSVAEELALYQLEQEGNELLIEQELREKTLAWMGDPLPPPTDEHSAQEPAAVGSSPRPLLWAAGIALVALLAAGLYRLLWREQPAAPPPVETPQQKPQEPAGQTPPAPTTTEPIAQQNKQTPPKKDRSVPPVKGRRSGELIAMAYYEKPDFGGVIRRSDNGNEEATNFPDERAAWTKGYFPTVIARLEKIPTSDPFYLQAQEMLGHAYYRNQNFLKAAATFTTIRSKDSGEMGEVAIWHEALSWLAAGQADRAKQLLEEIRADAGHPYREKAEKLLGDME